MRDVRDTLMLHLLPPRALVNIGVAGSFSGGGQPFCPAKIQSFPAKIFSCQGGPGSPILSCQASAQSYSAKLFCQWAKIADIWLKNMQNWKKNRKIWNIPTKNGRTLTKIREKVAACEVLQVILCQASHFCPAKLLLKATLTNCSANGQ